MAELNIKITNVFLRNRKSKKKININRGWTRSSKTYSLMQLAFNRLITWRIDDEKVFEEGVFSVVRKYSATLSATVIRDFEEIAAANNCAFLLSDKHRNKWEKTYKYKWRLLEFMWADDEQKIRWRKRDILYCNEANELQFDQEFFQLMIRTKYKIFLDFNPDDETIWIKEELEDKRAYDKWDVEIIVSTYKDNCYLEPSIIEEIEYLGKVNEAYWRIYWLWQYGKLEGLVFPERHTLEKFPLRYQFLWYGQDFWFTNDPAATIWLYLFQDGDKSWIIIDEIIYEKWLTNKDLTDLYEENWIEKNEEIVADSAEPKSIEEIFRTWYNIIPCDKGPDSVNFGIDLLKQYTIWITKRSHNVRKEFKKYSWKKDKNGKYLKVPIDKDNHAIDATRYVAGKNLKKSDIFITINDDRWR